MLTVGVYIYNLHSVICKVIKVLSGCDVYKACGKRYLYLKMTNIVLK